MPCRKQGKTPKEWHPAKHKIAGGHVEESRDLLVQFGGGGGHASSWIFGCLSVARAQKALEEVLQERVPCPRTYQKDSAG